MGCMQALAIGAPDARVRHPSVLELSAAGMLATAVILHLVALIPQYYGGPGQGSLWSEPDQAAQYLLLSAGWALALGVALTGPARVRLGAAIAVGVAATELGFRLSDLGEVFRYGSAAAAPGLWLMTAAWVVGAAGAALAVLAVHAQRGSASLAAAPGSTREESSAGFGVAGGDAGRASALSGPGRPQPVLSAGGSSAAPGAAPSFAAPIETRDAWRPEAAPASAAPEETRAAWGPEAAPVLRPPDATWPLSPGRSDATESLGPVRPDTTGTAGWGVGGWSDGMAAAAMAETPAGSVGAGPTALVALLALATAGAFLPAWDHYAGTATATGRDVSFNLGDAFSGPWQVVIGAVLTAAALVIIPVVAIRMRSRVTGAALVAGSLIVLGVAVHLRCGSVDNAVPPSVAGLSGAQASRLGLQLHMTLTGWFTFDLLAAFALFVAVMVVAHVREVSQDASSWESRPAAGPRQPAGLPPS